MNIVISSDINYIIPTGVMMKSICINNSFQQIHFFLLSSANIDESYIHELHTNIECYNAEISFITIPKKYTEHLPIFKTYQPQYITIATYFRLFLQSFLPPSIEKVLYLDGDIICTSSLVDLWNTDITDFSCAAVFDVDDGDERCKRLGYPKIDGYVNAGVLLINLKYWRQVNAESLFSSYIATHQNSIIYHDQDVLNATFHGTIKSLPVHYNLLNNYLVTSNYRFQYTDAEVDYARNHPVLIHYSSHLKPWYLGCPHPYAYVFDYYYKQSIWKDIRYVPFPSNSIKGKLSNILIRLGIKKYKGRYIRLNYCT